MSKNDSSVTKRKSVAAAPPVKRASVNDWPGVLAMLAELRDFESLTCVDPGTVNLAITRFVMHPEPRVSHAMVIAVDDLCKQLEIEEPHIRLRTNTGALDPNLENPDFSMQAQLYALRRFVEREARVGSGGCFDSTMLLVEEQSFDRLMSRVESVISSTFSTVRGDKALFTVLPGAVGGTISAAQVVTASSVKTCYAPLFPLVETSERPGRAFGVGDVRGSDKQRRANKRAVTKFGSLILSPDRMHNVMPSEYADRLIKLKKVDDFYDTIFMMGYFVSAYLFNIYNIRKRGVSRAMPAFQVLPQRENRRFEELIEIAAFFQIDGIDMNTLLEALFGNNAPII
jgi:hypothetical protein